MNLSFWLWYYFRTLIDVKKYSRKYGSTLIKKLLSIFWQYLIDMVTIFASEYDTFTSISTNTEKLLNSLGDIQNWRRAKFFNAYRIRRQNSSDDSYFQKCISKICAKDMRKVGINTEMTILTYTYETIFGKVKIKFDLRLNICRKDS